MTRKKVTLAYISNDSERKASYKKRKKGLIKKVSELSTLCGVDACAIIYSQYDPEPEVWPDQPKAQAILDRFRQLSDMDQGRKMVNQESFTRQRIKKATDQLRRLQKENKCRSLECYMYQCISGAATLDAFNLPDAAEMNWVANQTLRDIQAKQEALLAKQAGRQPAVAPPPPPMEEENMESFPWNLVQSPTGGNAAALEDGWGTGMALQGNNFNNVNNFNNSHSEQQGNYFNNFGTFNNSSSERQGNIQGKYFNSNFNASSSQRQGNLGNNNFDI